MYVLEKSRGKANKKLPRRAAFIQIQKLNIHSDLSEVKRPNPLNR